MDGSRVSAVIGNTVRPELKQVPFFSVTRRYRSDVIHSLTHLLIASTGLTDVMIPIEDFTDVILITLMKVN